MTGDSLRRLLILFLVGISMPYSAIEAANPSRRSPCKQACNDQCRSSRISARHIENKGIGYNTGYTTLEAFLAAPTDLWFVMPFVDLRGHIFNDGHWAANGGLGLRSLLKDRIYGAYAYYDYRDTQHKGYNQVSFGVETLGIFWDLRFNGYIVVGSRQSRPYDTKFSRFAGHNVYYTQKFQYALSGGNAELGFYPLKMQDVSLYTGIGPYYLKGPVGGAVWGGQARAKAMWKDYVGAEVSYSYDHAFKNIVQGQVFLSCPFGPKGQALGCKKRSCVDSYLLCQRMIEPVGKSEIIPVKTKKTKNLAIDPLTGAPYFFWFVNNLSSSNGTFESPYPMLSQAQEASSPQDIIYVFQGDGTTNGMDQGILLKNGQQLLGSGISHPLLISYGIIDIPALTPGYPVITNTGVGSNIVTLANDNLVSGIYTQLPAATTGRSGIFGQNITNGTFEQNLYEGESFGLSLIDSTGTFLVDRNQCNPSNAPSIPINIRNGSMIAAANETNITVSNNTFTNYGNVGIFLFSGQHWSQNAVIKGNQLAGAPGAIEALDVDCSGASTMDVLIENNSFRSNPRGISAVQRSAAYLSMHVISNDLTGNTIDGASIISGFGGGGTGTICLALSGNNTDTSYALTQSFHTTFNLESSSGNISAVQAINKGTILIFQPTPGLGSFNFVPPGTCP